MKQKTGRKLLSFLLTLTMVVGLVPGMGLTAYAATHTGTVASQNISAGDTISSGTTINGNDYSVEIDGTTVRRPDMTANWSAKNGYWTAPSEYLVDEVDTVTYYNLTIKLKTPTIAVSSVTLDKTAISISINGVTELTATVIPTNATNKKVKWITDTSAVKLYSDENCENEITLNTAVETLTVYAKGMSEGSAIVTVTSNADDTKSTSCAVTVNKANPTAPTGLTATYGQTLANVTLPDGWTWADSTQSVGNVVDPAATFKANFAGNDNYKAASNVDVTVTVGKADPTAPTGLTATYGQTLANVTLPDGWTWADSTQSVGNVVDPAATFKANFAGDDNHNAASNVDVTVTVGKANAVAATVTANSRTYDGTEKPLVTVTSEANGGEMQYALGTATEATQPYTTSIPTGTNAGTYYVWYKVVGDNNHNNSEATCVKATIKCAVKFVDEDGTVLKEVTGYDKGTKASDIVKPADPEKASTAEYTYKFDKWVLSTDEDKTIEDVTANETTYKATYEATKRNYKVTFQNDDGTELEKKEVEYGTKPEYTGTLPKKEATAENTYTFAGWTPEIGNVTADATYKATYTSIKNKYTVTWKNEDGTVLEEDENVEYGDTPKYDGSTPEKTADAQYTYTFKGWDNEITAVTGNVTYTAAYDSTVNKYSVTFVDEDGTTVIKEANKYDYGTAAADIVTPDDPTKEATAEYTYTFDKWVLSTDSTQTIGDLTADAIYKAAYKETKNEYTVTFNSNEGSAVASQTVEYGVKAAIPEKPVKEGCVFSGWYADEALTKVFDFESAIVGNITLYAKWDKQVSGVSVIPSEVKLTKAGETSQIKVTVTPADAANTRVTYKSGNTKVATVDASGKITAVANGTTDITVTTEDGGKTATVKVTVAIPDVPKQGEKEQPKTTEAPKTTEEPAKEEKAAISMNAGLKISQTGSKINIKWGKVSEADGYDVYVAYCGKEFGKAVKTVKKNSTTSVNVTKLNGKKINLKKNFKVYVTAYKMVDGKKVKLVKSIMGHVVGRKNTKYSNAKKITLSKSKYTIKVGKTAKVKAKTVLVDKGKKQLSDAHATEFRYASSDKNIATVDKSGKIKGVAKGTCTIYVYARNGYAKTVKVNVK